MERLNLNFSDLGDSSPSVSIDSPVEEESFKTTMNKQFALTKHKSSIKVAQERYEKNMTIFENEQLISLNKSMKGRVETRFRTLWNRKIASNRPSSPIVRYSNRDTVKNINKYDKSSKSVTGLDTSSRSDSLTKYETTRYDKILKYKKSLQEKRVERVSDRTYQIIYFCQFWIVFIVTVFVNVFACILIILEDVYRDQESTWDVFELVLMTYFIFEFILNFIFFRPPRYRMIFDWGTYVDLVTILPRLIRLIFGIEDAK